MSYLPRHTRLTPRKRRVGEALLPDRHHYNTSEQKSQGKKRNLKFEIENSLVGVQEYEYITQIKELQSKLRCRQTTDNLLIERKPRLLRNKLEKQKNSIVATR